MAPRYWDAHYTPERDEGARERMRFEPEYDEDIPTPQELAYDNWVLGGRRGPPPWAGIPGNPRP